MSDHCKATGYYRNHLLLTLVTVVRKTNTFYREADGLQRQKKTTLGGTPISSEEELVLTVPTGSPKLDNRRLEKALLGRDESQFLLRHSDGGVRM